MSKNFIEVKLKPVKADACRLLLDKNLSDCFKEELKTDMQLEYSEDAIKSKIIFSPDGVKLLGNKLERCEYSVHKYDELPEFWGNSSGDSPAMNQHFDGCIILTALDQTRECWWGGQQNNEWQCRTGIRFRRKTWEKINEANPCEWRYENFGGMSLHSNGVYLRRRFVLIHPNSVFYNEALRYCND